MCVARGWKRKPLSDTDMHAEVLDAQHLLARFEATKNKDKSRYTANTPTVRGMTQDDHATLYARGYHLAPGTWEDDKHSPAVAHDTSLGLQRARNTEREIKSKGLIPVPHKHFPVHPRHKARKGMAKSLGLFGGSYTLMKSMSLAAARLLTENNNVETVEVPYNHHPIDIQPPHRARKRHPFQGYVDFQGLQIDIENIPGSIRSGKDWSTHMYYAYGEIRGTEGADGDKLDCYVGNNHDSPLVVVIHQQDPQTLDYDEDKVMLGFDTVEAGVAAYKAQYSNPSFYQSHTALPMAQFWRWVRDRTNRGQRIVRKALVDAFASLV